MKVHRRDEESKTYRHDRDVELLRARLRQDSEQYNLVEKMNGSSDSHPAETCTTVTQMRTPSKRKLKLGTMPEISACSFLQSTRCDRFNHAVVPRWAGTGDCYCRQK